jgi:hypothetical protein
VGLVKPTDPIAGEGMRAGLRRVEVNVEGGHRKGNWELGTRDAGSVAAGSRLCYWAPGCGAQAPCNPTTEAAPMTAMTQSSRSFFPWLQEKQSVRKLSMVDDPPRETGIT